MIAGTLDHRGGARQSHRKALAGHAVEERLAGDRAVQRGIANDDVLGTGAAEVIGAAHDHASARQALARVVVGVAHQVERHAVRQERAKALAGGAVELDVDGVVRQAGVAETARDLRAQHRADRAVDVADRRDERGALLPLQRRPALLDQLVVKRLVQRMVLHVAVAARHVGRHRRTVEDAREVQPARLPVFDALAGVEQVAAADQLVEAADAELRHQLAHFLGHEEEVVDHVLRLAVEAGAQHRILGGHADRAGVQVALAHHDAAFDHQRRGGKAELVGAQHRADDHVASGLHLAVDLHRDAAAQPVEHERLLRLGQPQFPGRAGVLDRRHRRRARAAIVARDGHVVGLGLGHAGRHRTDADLGHQLDADAGAWIGVLQVVDQLRQILDRVDVVVRRGADEADTRHREAQLGDVVADLVARQLTALAGLGALGHLDLNLVGTDQVLGGHAEAAGGDLLDL